MSNIQTNEFLKLDIAVTATGAQTPVALSKTPSLGSAGVAGGLTGRRFRMEIPTLPLATSTTKIQTAPRIDPATGLAPASGSSTWTDVATLTSTSDQVQSVYLDYWVRANVTVQHADPNVEVFISGGF